MDKKETGLLFIIGILGFIIRLLWILHLDNTVDIWGDWWDEFAWNLVSGKGYMVKNPFIPSEGYYYSWRPPGFPLFLAGVYYLFGHSYLAAKIFLAIIGSFSAVPCYFIGRRMFDKTTGILAMLCITLYPTFIFFTGYLAPETLTLFCILVFMFFLTRDMERHSLLNYILAGVFLGYSILCRTIMSLFFIFVFLWMAFNYKNKMEIIKRLLLLVLFMVIIVLPWIIRNYYIHHTFVFNSTDGGQAFYINNNPQALKEPSGFAYFYNTEEFKGLNEIEVSRILYTRAVEFIKTHTLDFLKLIWRRFLNFWSPFPHTISGPGKTYSRTHQILSGLYTIPLFILAIIGFFYSLKNWRKLSIFYFLIIYYSGTYILVRATIRYRMPIEPYLILFASFGLCSLWTKVKNRHGNKNFLPHN